MLDRSIGPKVCSEGSAPTTTSADRRCPATHWSSWHHPDVEARNSICETIVCATTAGSTGAAGPAGMDADQNATGRSGRTSGTDSTRVDRAVRVPLPKWVALRRLGIQQLHVALSGIGPPTCPSHTARAWTDRTNGPCRPRPRPETVGHLLGRWQGATGENCGAETTRRQVPRPGPGLPAGRGHDRTR